MKIFKDQKKRITKRLYDQSIGGRDVTAILRYDDECGNGHNSFAITYEEKGMGGCCHDLIREHFPEFAELIQFHLFDDEGPMHYVANVCYFAGDKDCWGKTKSDIKEYGIKLANGKMLTVPRSFNPEYVFSEDKDTALKMAEQLGLNETALVPTAHHEGKERELKSAREAALWLDATDDDLTAPGLKERLKARLPALRKEFYRLMKKTGFKLPFENEEEQP